MAGAPKGNANAAKGKMWEGAIRRALNEGDRESLHRIATTVIQKAEAGEPWAVTEVRNTLDGKPKEHVQVDQNITGRVTYADRLEEASAAASARPSRQAPQHTVQ